MERIRRHGWDPPKHAKLCSDHLDEKFINRNHKLITLKLDAIPTRQIATRSSLSVVKHDHNYCLNQNYILHSDNGDLPSIVEGDINMEGEKDSDVSEKARSDSTPSDQDNELHTQRGVQDTDITSKGIKVMSCYSI